MSEEPAVRNAGCWIVVLAWNGWEDTEECLRSLAPVRTRGHRVVLVDNGSMDGTPARARAAFPGVEVLETGTNLGFAAGNNVGIRHALAGGAGAVILLNNDTTVAPDFADELVVAAASRPRVGTVTAKIYFHGEGDVLWFAGGSLSTWTGRATHRGYGRKDCGQFDEMCETDRPCACAMLLTRPALEDVGLLEESLFLYGEEIDWALRARARRWVGLFAPRARVWHKVSRGTGGEREGRFYYYAVRNMLATLERHALVRPRALAHLREIAVVGSFALSTLRTRVSVTSALREIRAGARDFRQGVTGVRPSDQHRDAQAQDRAHA